MKKLSFAAGLFANSLGYFFDRESRLLRCDGLRGVVAVRDRDDGHGVGACGIGCGLRGGQSARVGIELEAGDGVAEAIGGVDEAAQRGLDGDGDRIGIGAVSGA